MDITELKLAYQRLREAVHPEDVFGELQATEKEERKQELKSLFHQLARATHPDRYNGDTEAKEIATEAFRILNELRERAEVKIDHGTYGSRSHAAEAANESSRFVIKTRKREYAITDKLAEGDLSTVYAGVCINGEAENKVVIKVVRDPADNDLIMNEIAVLRLFGTEPGAQSKHLPVLLDQFRTSDDQVGIALHQFDGYDLLAVREKYQNGVPEKHLVWMLNRLLSVVGYAHSRGVIHGNIEPSHIMIRPRDHNLILLDWSYAAVNPAQTGEGFKVINPDFSAPEVEARKPPIPASDLYSIGKCMIYLLGGDLTIDSIPAKVNDRLARFIQFFVRKSAVQRPQDAWEMHDQLLHLIIELWGPRKFLDFTM